jgi:hypothetical protein
MNSQPNTRAPRTRHPGPHLGIVAIIFTVSFLARLYPVTIFGRKPYFPGPRESASTEGLNDFADTLLFGGSDSVACQLHDNVRLSHAWKAA